MTPRHFSLPKSPDAALPWLLILLAACYIAYYWSNPVVLWPDSGGYLKFSEYRTAGYPIFIRLIEAVFGTVDAVPKAQLIIAAASFAFLGWSVFIGLSANRAFGPLCTVIPAHAGTHEVARRSAIHSAFFALAPVLALMLYPQLGDVHGYILTESLFISLLCLLTGGLILMTRRPTWYLAAATALVCGLTITVRPAAVSLLIIWPFLFWLIWRRCDNRLGRRIALAAAVIVPITLCLVVENVLWHANHDSETRPNLADRHLFAKSLIIEPVLSLSKGWPSDPDLAALVSMGRDVMAPGRELIANAPSHYARTRLLVDFEVAAQHATYRRAFAPEIRAVAQQRGVSEYDVLAQVGRGAMLRSPVAWARNALAHYLGLWFPYWAYASPATLEEYQAYIENADPNSLFMDEPIFRHKEPPSPALQVMLRLTMAAGLLISTLAVGLAAWQRLRRHHDSPDSRLVIAALTGLAVHAHFLMVGLLGVVATRYAGAMGPLMATCGALLASWMIDQARGVEWRRHSARLRLVGGRMPSQPGSASAVLQRGGDHIRRGRVLPTGAAGRAGVRL